MVERDSSKESLHNERQVASKISSRLEIMHKKEMKKERNRGEEELRAATKKFRKEKTSSRKKQKKALHQIEKERIRWLSHQEELMMKLENSNLRVKGEKKRGQVLVQKEVDKSLAKEAQLQQKIEEIDSFTFELAEEVRDVDRKRRAAHMHAKYCKQLAHRRPKRSKELLKRLKELGELNQDLRDEAGSLIKALTAQEQIIERYRLNISQSQSLYRDLKRKWAIRK